MSDHAEAAIRLKMEMDGNAEKALEGMAKTTEQIDKNLVKVKTSAQQATKSLQELAYARVMEIKQERDVTLEANRMLRHYGLDPAGAPMARKRPDLGPTAGGAFRGLAGGALQAGGLGGVGGALGLVGGGAMVAAATAMVMAFEKGIQRVAGALEAQAGLHLSQSRRSMATAEALDPTGTISNLRRAADAAVYLPGKNIRDFEHAQRMAMIRTRGQTNRQAGGLFFDRRQAEIGAMATGAVGYAGLQRFDRSSMQGEVAYGEYQKRLPAQDEAVRAQRAVLAAQQGHGEQLAKVEAMQAGVAAARQELARRDTNIANLAAREDRGSGVRSRITGKELPSGGLLQQGHAKGQMDIALKEREKASLDLENKLSQLEDEKNRKKQTGLQLAEAEHQKRQASINSARAELEILQQREQRMSQQAQRLGVMNKGSRMQGLAASRFIKQFGIGAATPDIIAAAQAFAPDYVRKQAEGFGERNPEAQAGRREGFLFDQGNLNEIRQQIDKVQANIRVDIGLDEEKLATKLAEVLKQTFFDFLKDIAAKMQKSTSDVRGGKIQERNE